MPDLDPSGTQSPQESVQIPDSPEGLSIDDILAQHQASKEVPAAAQEAPSASETPPVVPEATPVPAPVVEPPRPAQDPELMRLVASLQEKERLYDERIREAEEARKRFEPLQRYAEVEQRLHEQDAAGALKLLGVQDPKALADAVAAQRGLNPTRALEQRLQKQLEDVKSAHEAQLQELRGYQRQAQEKEAFAEIDREVGARSPILSSLGPKSTQLVWSAMKGHYDRTGQVPTYDMVIPQVESQYRTILETALKSEAVRKSLGLAQSDEQKVTAPDPAPKTLTNKVASVVTARKETQELPEDQDARIDAIIRAAKQA